MEPSPKAKKFGESGFDPANDSPICHKFYPDEACTELMRRTKEMEPKLKTRPMSPCGCFIIVVIGSLIAGVALGALIYSMFFAT